MVSPQITVAIGIVMMLFVFFAFLGIWASRYRKVGPNEILVVSGRLRQLPDGTRVGYRIIKGGGTFVFPIYEKADVLSLDVIRVELTKVRVKAANGPAMVDCVAQVKVTGEDTAIVVAMQYFLNKSPDETKEVIKPVILTHLSEALSMATVQEIEADPSKYAARAQTGATGDLGKMGLGIVSLQIENVRPA